MAKRVHTVLLLTCVLGCEHVDTTTDEIIPRMGPSLSVAPEATTLRSSTRERVEAPPRDPRAVRREDMRNWFAALAPHQQHALRNVCRWQEENPCNGLLRRVGQPPVVDTRAKWLTAFDPTQRRAAARYCNELSPDVCETPLVIAFAGEAITFANHWPTASTPWLALDRDGDGAITSRAELFGDATVLVTGRTATNGFEALAALDDNADGVIDGRDAAFARLVLWADRDGDQRSSAGELRAATDVLVSLPLAHTRDWRCTVDGDCEGERGVVLWRNGTGLQTGAVVDVYMPRVD